MSYANPNALVSTQWVAEHLDAPDVRIVDASWFLPGDERVGRECYDECHLPGAVFFDIDEIADSDSDLPHMLPSPEKFSSRVRKLGLGDGVRIVIYDNNGFMASHRVWWTFRVFGHEDVAVMDGGLAKWRAEERPTEDLPPVPRERHFTPRINHTLVRGWQQVLAGLESKREQVADARPSARFRGEADEPRPGVRKGHMPGSVNVPVLSVLDQDHFNTMRPAKELRAVFENAGIDLAAPVITTCGSGVTASTLAFALHLLGHDDVSVYDGSWSEWGALADTPVEAG
ncbi:MAG: 3-mercaptopyruvate sulfurtransferase [Rhodospirillales bacterium]